MDLAPQPLPQKKKNTMIRLLVSYMQQSSSNVFERSQILQCIALIAHTLSQKLDDAE